MKKFFSSKWFRIWWRWSLLFAVIIALILWWAKPVPIVFSGISISRWFDVFSAPVSGLFLTISMYVNRNNASEELLVLSAVVLVFGLAFASSVLVIFGLISFLFVSLFFAISMFVGWLYYTKVFNTVLERKALNVVKNFLKKVLRKVLNVVKNFFCPK